MKREYPVMWAGASKFITTPLTMLVVCSFISRYFDRANQKELYPLCITAFGVSVAMAQLAFRFIPQVRKEDITHDLLYAGEKFSLCAMLTLQLLFIAFCKSALMPYLIAEKVPWWSIVADYILTMLWLFICSTAAWSWYWAYSVFHRQLWLNWEWRIADINEENKTKPVGKSEAQDSIQK